MALRGLGRDANAEVFAPYAEAAERVTQREIADAEEGASRADVVEAMVVGTVVFEAALATLRRLAHEHYSSIRLEGVSSSRQRSGRPSSSLHNEHYRLFGRGRREVREGSVPTDPCGVEAAESLPRRLRSERTTAPAVTMMLSSGYQSP